MINNGAGARITAPPPSCWTPPSHTASPLTTTLLHIHWTPYKTGCASIPKRKLSSIWSAVLKERYSNVTLIRQIGRPCTTNINDRLNDCHNGVPDDCHNGVPDDLLLSIVQLLAGQRRLLTITLYYTTGIIVFQGRACRTWVDQESNATRTLSTPLTN